MNTLDRSQPPQSGAIRSFDFPGVDRRALGNGLDLRVALMSRLPVVSVNLFIRSGEAGLSPERAGVCVLTGSALEGGTGRRSGTELAEALESIGARLDVGAGWEGTSIGISCLADRLPQAMALLAETVLQPAFPEDEVDRALEQHIAGIRQRAMDPASLASDEAQKRYFAEAVPYARPVDGTFESMEGVSRNDLRGYVDANYRPDQGGLIVVGDVDAGEVEQMAAEHLGGWTGAPASEADFDVRPASTERRVWVVDRPSSVQSEIRVGHIGIARDAPDYFPLSIANMVLGGVFTSRLNLNLREKNGFTYGVRSRFVHRSRPGFFQVSTSVGNDVTASAVREIVNELDGIAADGPTDDEVAAVRDFAAGIFGLQLETAGQVATRVTQLVVYGLPDGYFHQYRDAVRAVTTADAAGAARRHIRPEEAQIVVVGDADEIVPSIEALELGPIEVIPVS